MTKLQDDLKRKISNILAKAGSTTFQAEADALLDKARAMMEEHQISAFELGDDPITMLMSNMHQKGSPAETKYLVEAEVFEFYGCRAIHCGDGMGRAAFKYYGADSALQTATLMFPFIWKQVLDKSNAPGLGKNEKRKLQRSVSIFLCMRLRKIRSEAKAAAPAFEATDTHNALVLVETAVDDLVNQKHPNLTTPKDKVVKVAPGGKALADTISLDTQITGSKNSTLAIGRN